VMVSGRIEPEYEHQLQKLLVDLDVHAVI
jgi:hypothetical protein